jgi:hypothetical protein
MTDQTEGSTILVIYDDYEVEEGVKGIWSTSVQAVRKIGILNTQELATNLKTFCKQMGDIFEGVTTSISHYELNSVEIVIETTARGEVKLVGSGLAGDLKGGIKLVFARQNQED